MFPDVKILGIDLYTVAIAVGAVSAFILFRLLCDSRKIPTRIFNFTLLCATISLMFGYFCAVLFQTIYNFNMTGRWEFGSGATFYGGFIGAVALFLILFFAVGRHFFPDCKYRGSFFPIISAAAPCIALAHSIGRIGCLCAGCCYGKMTDSIFGIPMHLSGNVENRFPVQLYESIFLFLLALFLIYLVKKKQSVYVSCIYLIFYGVWRFFIEYLRDDQRGSVGISFFSPSQVTALILILCGTLLLFYIRKKEQKKE